MVVNTNKIKIPEILYHGTISNHVPSIREGIRLNLNATRPDFGYGFYLTTDFGQAVKWAIRKSKYENDNRLINGFEPVEPVIIVAKINLKILSNLSGKFFELPDVNWVEFVYNNRRGLNEGLHDYDFVFGPLADGEKLYYEIRDYENGLITIEKLANRLKPKDNQNQLSFHTYDSLNFIKIIGLKGVRRNV